MTRKGKEGSMKWQFVRGEKLLNNEIVLSVQVRNEPDSRPLFARYETTYSTIHEALEQAYGHYLVCRSPSGEIVSAADVSQELRLWGCWCVRQIWHLLVDDRSKKAVEVAEAFALSKATKAQLLQSRESAFKAKDKIRNSKNIDFYSPGWAAAEAAWAAICTTEEPSEMSSVAWHVNEASVASDVKRRISGEGYIRKYLDAELDKRILEVFETPGVTL